MKTEMDLFNLNRFMEAQNPVYAEVKKELKNGKKRTHWMWFIFPQMKGLGKSRTADFYAIKSRAEAENYLKHPVLGKRLLECCEILKELEENSAFKIFGFPDDMKLKSCLTLFSEISIENAIFGYVLQKFFDGKKDENTLEKIGG